MAAMDNDEFEADLERLRRLYVEANPSQRLHIAKQRIENPGHGPNQLVTAVAAVEGFARSLAMHRHAKSKPELSELYPKFKWKGPEELIQEILQTRGLGDPTRFFDAEDWRLFTYAVRYRNVLAHECTYLGQDLSPQLISSCYRVLAALARTQGLTFHEA